MAVVLRFKNDKQAALAATEAFRPSGRLGGGYLADLATLNKAIMLCESCQPKWNPAVYNYERRDVFRGQRIALGRCDGCNTNYSQCYMYLNKWS